MNNISNSELDNAELTEGVLVISRSKNQGIYERVLDKIEEDQIAEQEESFD